MIQFLLISYSPQNVLQYSLLMSKKMFGEIAVNYHMDLNLSTINPNQVLFDSTADSFGNIILIASDESSKFEMFLWNNMSNTLDLITTDSFNSSQNLQKSSFAFVKDSDFIVQIFTDDLNDLNIQLWSFEFNQNIFRIDQIGDPINILENIANDVFDDFTIAAIQDPGDDQFIHFLTSFSVQQKINATIGTISKTGELIKITPSTTVTFGSSPKFSVISFQSQIFVVLTNENGTCHQNEHKNKDANIQLCDQEPEPTVNLLNYASGLLETWREYLTGETNILNVCGDQIIVGEYDMGKNSISELILDQENNDIIFIEIHDGLTESIDSNCGAASSYSGVILDGFRIPFANI
ncbi:hypothetical protein M0811_00862 [Anaeramoeba ignava]|uniref:Uncharacterized protein n=1 Tax=Anaeramoeba ignava TaxID=1746090 RepID=A0A9Q0RC70_ANAIG|nr:hypothetical protein M0811_00862 [Anaeramoeba ignava]